MGVMGVTGGKCALWRYGGVKCAVCVWVVYVESERELAVCLFAWWVDGLAGWLVWPGMAGTVSTRPGLGSEAWFLACWLAVG